jgi:hypothetical protein
MGLGIGNGGLQVWPESRMQAEPKLCHGPFLLGLIQKAPSIRQINCDQDIKATRLFSARFKYLHSNGKDSFSPRSRDLGGLAGNINHSKQPYAPEDTVPQGLSSEFLLTEIKKY